MTTMQQITAGTNVATRMNENFETVSVAALYGKKQSTTTGLTWGYYGGLYRGNTVADGTVTLTNNTTNYIVVSRSTGAVSVSTGTTNWNDSTNYARVYKVTTASGLVTDAVDHRMDSGGLLATEPYVPLQAISIACGDEGTPLTTGTAKVTFHMPFAFDVAEVMAELRDVQASGSIFTVDINEAGSSILSTKLTIDNGEETSLTAATPPVISDSSLAKGAKVTIDIDQIGDGSAAGLKVHIIGRPA